MILLGCQTTDSTRYLISSHIYTYEVDQCMIKGTLCKIEGYWQCERAQELCVLAAYKKWMKIKKANGWD